MSRKKLLAAAKQSGCGDLGPWVKSIENHLYWSAASSAGHKNLTVPKWLSMLNHIRNIPVHENNLFAACLHGDVEPKEWLDGGKSYSLNGVYLLF